MSEVATPGVVEVPKPKPRAAKVEAQAGPWPGRVADAGLTLGFLATVFLLGAFPLKDTDFWWHLRTGDLIRASGVLPSADTYTFGAEGHRWVDLHWIFQVLLSVGYERIGVPGLNLAKCAVTCLAVWLLVSARRREWPAWAVLLAWLPALVVLAGRMYVRPETLTLLYLAAYLAILFRLDDRPALALLLPVVQVAWVNSQGLFVLGPVVLGFALVDAACRPGAFAAGRRRWWRTVLIATGLVGLACLVNPYGLAGALYPIQLASTMATPIFADTIAELEPLPSFIRKAGLGNAPLRVQLATMALGVLSFVVPIGWRAWDRYARPAAPALTPAGKGKGSRARAKAKGAAAEVGPRRVRPSLFRVLLFLAFTVLSWRASRNSHQFAAVVGAVTAWNFAEWAAEVARRRAERGAAGRRTAGRWVAAVAVAGLFVATATGGLYAWEGEGRTVGLGEEPHWFPHEAVAFAGRPDMPPRSICFHNGHAALYEYAHAPGRKTYADARLEVVGPEVYSRYIEIDRKIARNATGWEDDLDRLGRPLVLVDNVHAPMAAMAASLFTSKTYRCVWFDPVASLFVHKAYAGAVQAHGYDFADRHFRRPAPPSDAAGEVMMAKTCWNLTHSLLLAPRRGARELRAKLVWAGLDHAREACRLEPESAAGWKWAGMLEFYRDDFPTGDPIPRFRMTFDPAFDLSAVRASHDLRQALDRAPDDGNTLVTLAGLDIQRGMYASALASLDRFLARPAEQLHEKASRAGAEAQRPGVVARLGAPPESMAWANLSALDRLVNDLYDHGRAAEAASLLDSAYPAESRPWEVVDRIATIWLHLGEARRAARHWSEAKSPPSEAVRKARVAAARLAQGDFDAARAAYRTALELDPRLFEAHYGLAVLEADSGHADEALISARGADLVAPNGAARSAVARLVADVSPYRTP